MASLSRGTNNEKGSQRTPEVTTSIEFPYRDRRTKDPKHLQAQLEPRLKKAKREHLLPSAVDNSSSTLPQTAALAPKRKPRRVRESRRDLSRSGQLHEFRILDRLSPASASGASELNAETSGQVPQQDQSAACRHMHREDVPHGARELDYKLGAGATLESINMQQSWPKTKREIPEDPLSRDARRDNYDDMRRWRQGVADDDTMSVATSVEGEFITPLAAARMELPSDDSRVFRETTPIIPPCSQSTIFGYML